MQYVVFIPRHTDNDMDKPKFVHLAMPGNMLTLCRRPVESYLLVSGVSARRIIRDGGYDLDSETGAYKLCKQCAFRAEQYARTEGKS
jgi:hypothetical protein